MVEAQFDKIMTLFMLNTYFIPDIELIIVLFIIERGLIPCTSRLGFIRAFHGTWSVISAGSSRQQHL